MNAGECPRSLCLCFSQNKINVQQKEKTLKVSKEDTAGREREHFPQLTFYLETFRPTLKHNKNCLVCLLC